MVAMAGTNPLPVLFLWHHHQPFYKAPGEERPWLPWVRLHAVKGYLDMVTAVRECGAKVTFNFSPSLLEQLREGAQLIPADEFERVSRVPAPDLTAKDRGFLLEHFFAVDWGQNVLSHKRYKELLSKRGEHFSESSAKTTIADFSHQDLTDLIALFNLSWIGFCGRRSPEIAELLAKQRSYTAEDIGRILDFHHRMMTDALTQYSALREEGLIEISTSPYAHPILPLLCDTRTAERDIIRQHLPKTIYQRPDDAARHLKSAVTVYDEVWGGPPSGLWPSEGSVSDEALQLAAAAGFKWAASDQAVLDRSDRTLTENGVHLNAHLWERDGHSMQMYFRDHALSDAIGFRYASMTADDAAADFIGHLETIEKATRRDAGRCVAVILDGENPWEKYGGSGEAFLKTLYTAIDKHSQLKLSTFSEHLQFGTRHRIHSIHPGSWINADFRIWIGDPEKNRAWTELARARRVLDRFIAGDPAYDKCWPWLARAQGSDWFWWYGKPFQTPYEKQYDALFRRYLQEVYTVAGFEAPPTLDIPLIGISLTERRYQPPYTISPDVDGRITSYYEWIGSCCVEPRHFGGSMAQVDSLIDALYYGFDESHLFVRVDFVRKPPDNSGTLRLNVLGSDLAEFKLDFNSDEESGSESGLRWAYRQILEIAVDIEPAHIQRGDECQFWIELETAAGLEKLPPSGAIRFHLPTCEELASNWLV